MNLMRFFEDSNKKEVQRLSDKHKSAVQIAINQIENGDFITNDQANMEIDKWLRKSG